MPSAQLPSLTAFPVATAQEVELSLLKIPFIVPPNEESTPGTMKGIWKMQQSIKEEPSPAAPTGGPRHAGVALDGQV